jgi:hypothetical protein
VALYAIAINPKFSGTITHLFGWYATDTLSLKQLAAEVQSAGLVYRRTGGPLPTSNLHAILRNRLYTGDFDWNGRRYVDRHQPIVSRELWERVQGVLDGRHASKSGRKTKRDFAFSGLIKCGHCGCALVGELKKKRYVYYHCTGYKGKCLEPYVREEVASEQFSSNRMRRGHCGIGGGFLIVPALMLAAGMPMLNAIGSSLLSVTTFGLTTRETMPGPV